jgi:subtilisin-like proprotein convertase family protein
VVMRAHTRRRLALIAGALLAVALVASGPADAKKRTRTFSSGPLGTPVGDNAAAASRLVLPKGRIRDVNVFVRLDHGRNEDVDLSLLPPRGVPLILSTDNGETGNNYGAGTNDCTGSFTAFDDEAPVAIAQATSPFVGFFRPEHSLAALDDVKMQGPWWFLFADDAGGNSGFLGCWALQVTYKVKKGS